MRMYHWLYAFVCIATLQACSHVPLQRTWSDIDFPAQSVRLEIQNAEGMSPEESAKVRTAIIDALQDFNIAVDPKARRALRVTIKAYNEQSGLVTFLRVALNISWPGAWAFYSNNELRVQAELIGPDGNVLPLDDSLKFTEHARNFKELVRSVALRIATSVLTAPSIERDQRSIAASISN